MPNRFDRMISFNKIADTLGLIDFSIITPPNPNDFKEKESNMTLTCQSCKQAHLDCYEDAIKNSYKRILIFEDDICFNQEDPTVLENIDSYLEECTKFLSTDDWDIFYYDNWFRGLKENQCLIKVRRLSTIKNIQPISGKVFQHSYALTLDSCKILLKYNNENDCTNDICARNIIGLRKFFFSKGIFDQLFDHPTDNDWLK